MFRFNRRSPHNPLPKSESPWKEGVQTITLSLFLAFGIRTYIAEARYVPTGSMQPTIEINDRLMVDKLTYRWQNPQRGDIIVFTPPQALVEQNMKDNMVKRLIGLPGDRVEIKNGTVWVNGEVLTENYTKEAAQYEMPAVTVPENQYLMLGDNRNNSYDSHYWGFVPRENIIGRAVVRFYPFDRIGGM
jgi:signal peptidase I